MSAYHEVTLKPINEIAEYKRNLIPASIPEGYALKPMLGSVANDDWIRKGIVAFRDFLFLFCDHLISDGQFYAKPPKKPSSMSDYPFLNNITNMLVEIGYLGKFIENGNSLLITKLPLCIAQVDVSGKKKPPKIPVSAQIECLRFLSLCGFVFSSIDLTAKTLDVSDTQPLKVSYPKNPSLLAGLKALSIADMELREGRRYWNDHNLLRCDYFFLLFEKWL